MRLIVSTNLKSTKWQKRRAHQKELVDSHISLLPGKGTPQLIVVFFLHHCQAGVHCDVTRTVMSLTPQVLCALGFTKQVHDHALRYFFTVLLFCNECILCVTRTCLLNREIIASGAVRRLGYSPLGFYKWKYRAEKKSWLLLLLYGSSCPKQDY